MKRLLSLREMCALLGIHPSTAYRKLDAGELINPVFGRGRKLMFDPDTLRSFIASQSISPANTPHNAAPPPINIPTDKQTLSFHERQKIAEQKLLSHAAGRRKSEQ